MKKNQKLTLENKGKIINEIIGIVKASAKKANVSNLDAGDLFFKLAFMEDKKLLKLYSQIS
jgi:hypothetical protein